MPSMMMSHSLRWYIESGVTSVRDVASHGSVPFRLKEAISQNRVPGPRLFSVGQTTSGTGGHGVEGNYPLLERSSLMAEGTYDGANEWRLNVREQFNMGADLIKAASAYERAEIAAAIGEAHVLGITVATDAHVPYLEWAIEEGVDCVEHIGITRQTDKVIKMMAEKEVGSCPTVRRGREDPAVREIFRKMKAAGIKMCIGIDEGARIFLYPYKCHI